MPIRFVPSHLSEKHFSITGVKCILSKGCAVDLIPAFYTNDAISWPEAAISNLEINLADQLRKTEAYFCLGRRYGLLGRRRVAGRNMIFDTLREPVDIPGILNVASNTLDQPLIIGHRYPLCCMKLRQAIV